MDASDEVTLEKFPARKFEQRGIVHRLTGADRQYAFMQVLIGESGMRLTDERLDLSGRACPGMDVNAPASIVLPGCASQSRVHDLLSARKQMNV